MLATCLINSFNYRPYVGEAVESALGQSRPFDQILVIDDGSTDGSRQFLEQRFGSTPRVQIIGKENGGQLSCFNAAIPHVTGDVLFFLDADDRFRPSYLATALECYDRACADFLIVGLENFSENQRRTAMKSVDRDWGFSVLSTLLAGTWVGAPTSCLSMRTSLARRILPFPFEPEWRIQADNVLVYGASVLGAHKYELGETLIERRVHGSNLYFGRRMDPRQSMRFELIKNRLIAWYARQAGYDLADLPRLLPREFRTLARPTMREYRRYLRMAWNASLSLTTRVKQTASLTAHFVKSRRASTPIAEASTTTPVERRIAA
jgi:glycosyltransferase involved in cell wall biosynthesis